MVSQSPAASALKLEAAAGVGHPTAMPGLDAPFRHPLFTNDRFKDNHKAPRILSKRLWGLPTSDASEISGINVDCLFFFQAVTLSPNPWDLTLSCQNA